MNSYEYQKVNYYIGRGLIGLKNIGNTCFLNSSIQALSNTLPLTHYILSDKWKEDVSDTNKKRHEYYILSNYIRLLVEVWKEKPNNDLSIKQGMLVPRTFKSNLEVFVKKYVGYDQHDAHECITYILEYIHKAMSREIKMNLIDGDYPEELIDGVSRWKGLFEKDYSFIIELFYGELQGVTTCVECNYSSKIYDPYSTLTLLLPNNNEECNLQNLLKKHLTDKNITDWKCERCNILTQCNHETNIISMPPILIVHLKRFKVLNNRAMAKNNNEVDFKEHEEIYGRKYRLYSIIHHSGDLNGGHYINTSRNMNGEWYLYNDGSVTKISSNEAFNKRSSYVLFYEKVIK